VASRQDTLLVDNTVYGVVEDTRGFLWLPTNRGLTRLSPDFRQTRHFGRAAGLPFLEFNDRAISGRGDGSREFFFGGVGGVLRVRPEYLTESEASFPVRITELMTVDPGTGREQPIVEPHQISTQVIDVAPDIQDLRFTYVGLEFVESAELQYEYRLLPRESEWLLGGASRVARYTDLAPGHYTFEVRARSSLAGVTAPARATFQVRAPFWKTAWFMGIAGCGVLGLVYGAHKLRTQRLERRRDHLKAEVKRQTLELRDSLAVISDQADHLQELDQFRSRHIGNVAQDLRTPLTLMLMHLDRLGADLEVSAIPAEARDEFDRVASSAGRLGRLVDQMFDLARIDAGRLVLTRVPMNLGHWVDDWTGELMPLAAQWSVQVALETASDILVVADPGRLAMAFQNLLKNAITAASPGGTVRVEVFERVGENQEAVVRLEDDGPGVEEHDRDRDRIFDRYHRGTAAYEGIGIGLDLALELARAHGGDITAGESIHLGGALFDLSLPRADIDEIKRTEDSVGHSALLERQAGPIERYRRMITGTVLAIEDDEELGAQLSNLFSSSYRCVVVRTAEEGLHLAAEVIPDVILCDVELPGMDGIDYCRAIRRQSETRHIPIILISGRTTEADRLAGLMAGADDYVAKPIVLQELAARVMRQVEREAGGSRFKKRGVEALARRLLARHSVRYEYNGAALELASAALENSPDQSTTVETLASELAISRVHLYRRSKKLFGVAPSELLVRARLELAAERLRAGEERVGEVASAVGFRSQSHFSKRFSSYFGVAPSRFAEEDAADD
jgi:signal transduction histidine kinase/DNA-binding response OmpR family regulator